jgi:hypothetical protein
METEGDMQTPESLVELKRNLRWIFAGVVSTAVLIFILGPGVRFGA